VLLLALGHDPVRAAHHPARTAASSHAVYVGLKRLHASPACLR